MTLKEFLQSKSVIDILNQDKDLISAHASIPLDHCLKLLKDNDILALPIYEYVPVDEATASLLIHQGKYKLQRETDRPLPNDAFYLKQYIGLVDIFDVLTYINYQPSLCKHETDSLIRDPMKTRLTFLSHEIRNLLGITRESESFCTIDPKDSLKELADLYTNDRNHRVIVGDEVYFNKNGFFSLFCIKEDTKAKVEQNRSHSNSLPIPHPHHYNHLFHSYPTEVVSAYSPYAVSPSDHAPFFAIDSPQPSSVKPQAIINLIPVKEPKIITHKDFVRFIFHQTQLDESIKVKTIVKKKSNRRCSVGSWHQLLHDLGDSHKLISITTDESAFVGLKRMFENKVHSVAILQNNKLVGNLSASDIRTLTADNVESLLKPIKEFKDLHLGRVISCNLEDSIQAAVQKMLENNVHRLWIEDKNNDGELLLITMSDILQYVTK
jgi:CBS domain-containing protein